MVFGMVSRKKRKEGTAYIARAVRREDPAQASTYTSVRDNRGVQATC